jgi:hypothetical protein
MRRLRVFKFLAPFATACVVAGTMTGAIVAATAGTAAAAKPAASACLFNGQSDTGLVKGITPGAVVTVTCTGLPANTLVILAEASPLAGILPSSEAIHEADAGALGTATSTSTGTLPPGTTFKIPDPFKAGDPDAVCPPTQAQVNTGLVGCAVAVAELSGEDFGDALLQYTGQVEPQAPTLSLGSASAHAGDQVTVANGAGPGDWWGDATGTTQISSSDIKVDGVQAGSTKASVGPATYSITVSKKGVVTPGPLNKEPLSGSFTVPCGVAGNQTVTVTEPNGSPQPGTISASAPLDVLPGTTPAVTSISPTHGASGGGTSVTIGGCNFTSATAVTFGGKAAASFHINSDTSITAVSPPGKGTVAVVVTGPGGHSATNSASDFTYGFQGYDLVGGDGGVFSFGDAKSFGSLPGLGVTPAKPIVGVAATSDGGGYWLAGADGGIFAFGDAKEHGSLPGLGVVPAQPVVGIATPDIGGYWLVGADGGVFAFGDAKNFGSLPGLGVVPSSPIVGIAPTPDGGGYWLVGADGGVFAFGDAKEFGSLPGLGVTPAKPVVGIAASDAGGYWLVGADGGTFAFGDAKPLGSLPGLGVTPAMPVVGIVTPDTGGYWLVGADGGVYSFGDAKFFGSMGGTTLAAPVTGAGLA